MVKDHRFFYIRHSPDMSCMYLHTAYFQIVSL